MFGIKSFDLEKMISKAPKYDVPFNEGLNDQQVQERVEAGLLNKPRKTVTKSYFEIIVKNVFTVLNVLLLTVAIVILYFAQYDATLYKRLFFFIILLLNIGISLFQDIKARKLVGKLTLLSSPRAEVVRNGSKRKVNFKELVLGDIIILKAGNTVPCDAVVVNGIVRANESLLSGETEDVRKEVNDPLYAESVITSGFAYARIVKVGNANYVSKLQEKAKALTRPKSEILESLTYIIRGISIAAIVIGVIEIVTYGAKAALGNGSDITSIVDKVGSSVVGMIPIGMYLMTSVTLTVGVIILARRRILVRELYSIEMLARVSVVCLDKTGTLTDGTMKVKELVPVGDKSIEYLGEAISTLLSITRDDNLTARALKEKFSLMPVDGNFTAIPFDSEKKYSAASFDRHTYAIGAYGFLKISNAKEIKETVENYESSGYRVLILAEANEGIANNKLPKKIEAIGIIVLNENIKADAKANIEWFKTSDVGIRIISGDSVLSLKNIARDVGIEGYENAVSLEGKSDDQVRRLVHEKIIFGRVSPDQKKVIIDELHAMGNTVAMIGDGVNDLLALKAADCSIAMASGSDAAKAASHLVSLDSNFSALPKVVEEGRRVINNLQRVCSIFLVKTIFAIVFSSLFLILQWAGVGEGYPFDTNSLMAWEILTIGIAPFFIALEPNKERIKGGFIKNIFKEALPGAIAQILVALPVICFKFIPGLDISEEGAKATAVILISITSFIVLFRVCQPLNAYRLKVLLGTFVALGLFFVFDSVLFIFKSTGGGSPLLNINYYAISFDCLVMMGVMLVIAVPLYFLIGYLFRRFVGNKKDE